MSRFASPRTRRVQGVWAVSAYRMTSNCMIWKRRRWVAFRSWTFLPWLVRRLALLYRRLVQWVLVLQAVVWRTMARRC